MRKRISVILFSTAIAIFSLVVLQQVFAVSQIENNNGLTVNEGESGTITANELSVTDTEGIYTVFTYTVLTAPVHGNLRNNTTPLTVNDIFTQGLIDAGLLNYLHDGSETTSDSFDFNVTNGVSTFVTSTFQITITPVNDAPTGLDDTAVVSESGTITQVNTPLTNTVLANDTDPDSATLTATLSAGPVNASSFTLYSDGTFSYTHDGSETTSDSFTYNVCDAEPLCDSATVTITVQPVNDPPIALDDTAVVSEGGTITQVNTPLTNSVLDNDADVDSSPLTATLTSSPANAGSFFFYANGTFTYTHNGSETTSDSFTYEVCDAEPLCDTATVTITINPVNDAPTAVDDAKNVDEGGATSGNVQANDSDPDSSNLTSSVITAPLYASAFNLNADGTYTYTHDGSENFSDEFTYELCDNHPTDPQCASAKVVITINPINDAPVANDDTALISEGELLTITPNVTDAEGDNLTITQIITPPAHASSITINGGVSITYQHDGNLAILPPQTQSDFYVYEICDDGVPSKCDTARIDITITPTDDPPLAVADTFTVAEGNTLNDTVNPTPGPCASSSNDCDEEGDPFVVITTTINPPSYADSFSLQSDGSFTYVHDGSETTSDSFTYRICKNANSPIQECSQTDVTINITPVNDAPIPGDDTMTVPRGTTVATLDGGVTSLLADDTDPENDNLTVTATPVSGPAHGALTLNADGTFSYTHDDSDAPTDSFTYEVCDDGTPSRCATAVVSITIGPRPISTVFLPLLLKDYPPVEPNNNACDSYQIGLNATLTFTADDQEDWYTFSLNQTTSLNITLSNATAQGGQATQLIVYRGDCRNLIFVGNNGEFDQVKTLSLPNMPPDIYYVRVYSDPVPNEDYTLRVTTQ